MARKDKVVADLTKGIDRTTLSIMGVKGSEPMMSPNDGISSYGNWTRRAASNAIARSILACNR